MHPRPFLRAEGLAVLVGCLGAYLWLGGSIPLLVVLALAPDASMAGYLVDGRLGGWGYNLAHTYVGPIALGGLALFFDVRIALLLALIWAGHIGADRLAGFGLKYEDGFANTHLDTQPCPVGLAIEARDRLRGRSGGRLRQRS